MGWGKCQSQTGRGGRAVACRAGRAGRARSTVRGTDRADGTAATDGTIDVGARFLTRTFTGAGAGRAGRTGRAGIADCAGRTGRAGRADRAALGGKKFDISC